MTEHVNTEEILAGVKRMARDLANSAALLSRDEARFLVDAYYQMQKSRIRAGNQLRSLKDKEPAAVLTWFSEQNEVLEQQVKRALDKYSGASRHGEWARSITGIGPVLAAGLLAHIHIGYWCAKCHGLDEQDCADRQKRKPDLWPAHDFERVESCPTVGHIWRFAGLDPTVEWKTGQKRPWNASLKTLCWKIGESFVKVSGREGDVYGKHYLARKELETGRNEAGAFSEKAKATLERFRIAKDTEAYRHYITGKLPPGHIHARAKRYAVKLFLSHYHHMGWRLEMGREPPYPYPLAILGHAHYIPPPHQNLGE